jgi:hypothetical protein
MAVDKKLPQNDEIDLVDLLGVVIKHRRFIFWFVVVTTFVGALFLGFREYRKTITVGKMYKLDSAISTDTSEDGYKLEDSLSTDKDTMLVTYMFLKKGVEKGSYSSFLSSVLYPTAIGVPSFEIINNLSGATYLFRNETDLKNFMNQYNTFVDILGKASESRQKLSDEAFSKCKQFNLNSANTSAKDLLVWFKSSDDMKYCSLYYYYSSLAQARIAYALDMAVHDSYMPFLIDFIGGDAQKIKLVTSTKTKEIKDKIKIAPKADFNKKKVLKYSVLVLILTVILSFFLVFVLEFWTNNRSKLDRYWK